MFIFLSRKTYMRSLHKRYKKIVKVYRHLEERIKGYEYIIDSGKWLIDNLYLIEKEFNRIQVDIPIKAYKKLPKTKGGLPRVYVLCENLIENSEGYVTGAVIRTYFEEYLSHKELSMGEIWSIPAILKGIIINRISYISEDIIKIQKAREVGEKLGEQIINSKDREHIEKILLSIKSSVEGTHTYIEEVLVSLLKTLRDNGISDDYIYEYINKILRKNNLIEHTIINKAEKIHGKLLREISNHINSLKCLESIIWKYYFEELSSVEKNLTMDPSGIYINMDFKSRDYYRHSIEKIARKMNIKEICVSRKSIELSGKYSKDNIRNHVGYFLVDEGKKLLIKELKGKSSGSIKNINKKFIISLGYIGGIVALSVCLDLILVFLTFMKYGTVGNWRYILAFLVMIIPMSEVAMTLINWSISVLKEPTFVPKMDLSNGIGKENATIVVIPTLLTDKKHIDELIKKLEVYYLGNIDENIYFAMLGDFIDSTYRESSMDKDIEEYAVQKVKELQYKYGENKFYFLGRKRTYNSADGIWMGWERKRGKLYEFNRLLRGNEDTYFNTIIGDLDEIKKCKYVITLDDDTELPLECASRLVGAISHPLNKVEIDYENGKILRGYGIIQPRVEISHEASNKTLFSRILSGEVGLDIYSCAVSNVYEDLFKEGIFTGKGIYDIDAFNTVLKNKIPENMVLSHDLLEGCYMKVALATDIELTDGYPSNVKAYYKRLHRWIRGDWQISPWLINNEISLIDKFKIIDNLRRSLLAISIMAIFTLDVFNILPGNRELWNTCSLLSIMVPIFLEMSTEVSLFDSNLKFMVRLNNISLKIQQCFLKIIFLPYEAYKSADAIVRAIYRMKKSKKNLLEWVSADVIENNLDNSFSGFINDMHIVSIIAAMYIVIYVYRSRTIGVSTISILSLWIISPIIAFKISEICHDVKYDLNKEEEVYLRTVARRIWAYFEDFVNKESNWLPPDNYQEEPYKGIAKRTSPTNIGMGLMANLCAYKLGYIGRIEFIDRNKNMVDTLKNMEKINGHFLNWYDIDSKKPLNPKFVSTVDSGNLAAYLWIISTAISNLPKEPYEIKNKISGICDTLRLASIEMNEKVKEDYGLETLSQNIEKRSYDLENFRNTLDYVESIIKEIREMHLDHELVWCDKLSRSILNYQRELEILGEGEDKKVIITSETEIEDLKRINLEIIRLLNNMEFKFLYSNEKELFSIGYDVESASIVNSYYDMLASEARVASFISIAKGEIAKEHWFKLGRNLAEIEGIPTLISWSGTMFEYFMPKLIMKSFHGTLLDDTYRGVMKAQRKYCSNKEVPFGISESGYFKFDLSDNYQYKAFGVQSIGAKSGLDEELVVAPYATFIGMMEDVHLSYENLVKLRELGLEGKYGFYEAVDYTQNRIKIGSKYSIVKSFMVHHEGMSLMAITNILADNALVNIFHDIPEVKSSEILLKEKTWKNIITKSKYEFKENSLNLEEENIILRKIKNCSRRYPEVLLMGNGEYSLMISSNGNGYASFKDIILYRWRRDTVLDRGGVRFYIRKDGEKSYYSPYFEGGKKYEHEELIFSTYKAEFKKIFESISSRYWCIVSAEENLEVRTIEFENHQEEECELELTSYLEVALCNYKQDLVHPAFSNLFISTEFDYENSILMATRRNRKEDEDKYWMYMFYANNNELLEFESDRYEFIGRGRDCENPLVIESNSSLKGKVGAVLDPIMALRKQIKIQGKGKGKLSLIIGIAEEKDKIYDIFKKYNRHKSIGKQEQMSLNASKIEMKYQGLKSTQINLYNEIAARIIYYTPFMKSREAYIKDIKGYQNTLWENGISGDLPIVLVEVKNEKALNVLSQLIKAHEYLYKKNLKFDLVAINYEKATYNEPQNEKIFRLINASSIRNKQNSKGGVFVLNKLNVNDTQLNLLRAISRIYIEGNRDILKPNEIQEKVMEYENEYSSFNKSIVSLEKKIKDDNILEFYNGYGGFDNNRKSYIIKNLCTPNPWINLIANKYFGTIISESGSTYTWNENSRENKLTLWSNDPISNRSGEYLYVCDETKKEFFTIPSKSKESSPIEYVEHGKGFSTFKYSTNEIEGQIEVTVPVDERVKLCRVTLKNMTEVERKLKIIYYCEITKGVVPEDSYSTISTAINSEKGYMYAVNPYNQSFKDKVSYLCILGGRNKSFTGSRYGFIGETRSLYNPKGIKYSKLDNSCGAGEESCLTCQCEVMIESGEEKDIYILLGEENSLKDIEEKIEEYKININNIKYKKEASKTYWDNLLSSIVIRTPDEAFNEIMNGWLIYQTLSCRIWARTALYQCGGAYGFRDQLQDVMSLIYFDKNIAREHILLSASRMFEEGDVQHWWHPVVNSGIRTRFSDDLLWLPYVTYEYVSKTGDYSILDEEVGYLKDALLDEGVDERYNISPESHLKDTLYEHCNRAIERALNFGEHGLPLMGSGDWNDGMSTVGNEGKGESVWLGWFMYDILAKFSKVCAKYKHEDKIQKYEEIMANLRKNLSENAWDGEWYRRAFFDDGKVLGSKENEDCKIDAISQSWSIISGAGYIEKAKKAMESFNKYLVLHEPFDENIDDNNHIESNKESKVISLLAPPFKDGKESPGYIKAYVAGVRENGGQYTHGAIWSIVAYCNMRECQKAFELFQIINPINHTLTKEETDIYRNEPYVVSADVYYNDKFKGRAGWSWYTGASGWLYKAGLENILGFTMSEGRYISISPCIPTQWKEYTIEYRYNEAIYNIKVIKGKTDRIIVDNEEIKEKYIPLKEKGEYIVEIEYNGEVKK